MWVAGLLGILTSLSMEDCVAGKSNPPSLLHACVSELTLYICMKQFNKSLNAHSSTWEIQSIPVSCGYALYHFIHVLPGSSYWCFKLMLTAGHVKVPDSTCSLALPPNLTQSIKRVTGDDGFLSLTVDPESFAHWLGGSGGRIQTDGTCGTGWSDHERRAINVVPVSCHDVYHSNRVELA